MSAERPVVLNPYTPGVGTQPPVLVGRDIQLAVIDQTARLIEGGREPQHVILTGLRGVGKTVLVKEGMRRLRARRWLCGYYEVRRDVDAGVAIAAIVAGGATLLPRRTKLAVALRKLRASIGSASLSGAADGTVSISISPRPGTTDPYFEALRLFQQLGAAAAEDSVGVALCVDELQTFRRKDATTLLQALEAGEGADARVLLLGAGLPMTGVELAKANTYAERFRYEVLDDLSPREAARAVEEPAAAGGVLWQPEALARVVDVARGYPFFLQLYASEAWDAAERRDAGLTAVTAEDVEVSLPLAQRRLDQGIYATRFGRASTFERLYLTSMAELMGAGDRAGTPDVARRLGKSLAELSTTRDRLIRKGVVHAPEPGQLEFSIPGFKQYLLRQARARSVG
ncbi:MAG: AAA family ATPase [Candidatus Dormibacter sp.]